MTMMTIKKKENRWIKNIFRSEKQFFFSRFSVLLHLLLFFLRICTSMHMFRRVGVNFSRYSISGKIDRNARWVIRVWYDYNWGLDRVPPPVYINIPLTHGSHLYRCYYVPVRSDLLCLWRKKGRVKKGRKNKINRKRRHMWNKKKLRERKREK